MIEEFSELYTSIDCSGHNQKITKCVYAHSVNKFTACFKES